MGCYCCGTRQTDPAKGASPWQRGVVRGEQVLGCPGCQASGAWGAALDRCAACGSTALVRRLGETVCRACGATTGSGEDGPGEVATERAPGLADEVADALDRLLRRGARE